MSPARGQRWSPLMTSGFFMVRVDSMRKGVLLIPYKFLQSKMVSNPKNLFKGVVDELVATEEVTTQTEEKENTSPQRPNGKLPTTCNSAFEFAVPVRPKYFLRSALRTSSREALGRPNQTASSDKPQKPTPQQSTKKQSMFNRKVQEPVRFEDCPSIPFSSDLGIALMKRDCHSCSDAAVRESLEVMELSINRKPAPSRKTKFKVTYKERNTAKDTSRTYVFPKRQLQQYQSDTTQDEKE